MYYCYLGFREKDFLQKRKKLHLMKKRIFLLDDFISKNKELESKEKISTLEKVKNSLISHLQKAVKPYLKYSKEKFDETRQESYVKEEMVMIFEDDMVNLYEYFQANKLDLAVINDFYSSKTNQKIKECGESIIENYSYLDENLVKQVVELFFSYHIYITSKKLWKRLEMYDSFEKIDKTGLENRIKKSSEEVNEKLLQIYFLDHQEHFDHFVELLIDIFKLDGGIYEQKKY